MSELYGFRKNLERVQVRSKADSVAKSNVIPVLITDTPVTAGSKNVFVDLSVPDLANWNVVVLRCRCVNTQQNIIFFRGYTTQNYLVDSLTSTTSRAVFYVDWDNNRVRVSWTHGNVSLANSIQILAVYGLVQNVYAVEGDDTDEPSEDEEDIDITALTEEVQGIRIGADGTIYDTAGDAVRGQYEQLAQILENLDVPAISEAIQSAVDTAIAQIEQSGGLIIDDTATTDDVGKALIVQSVIDGVVTFTFGESGSDITVPTYSPSSTYAVGSYCMYSDTIYRCNTPIITAEAWTVAHWTAITASEMIADMNEKLNMLVEYQAVEEEEEETTDIVQLVDPDDITWEAVSGKYRVYIPYVPLNNNGAYYPNPYAETSSGLWGGSLNYVRFYDANNNELTLTNTSDSSTKTNINIFSTYGSRIEIENHRTIKVYVRSTSLSYTYTTDADIAYMGGASCYFTNVTNNDIQVGVTYGGYSTSYVSYDGGGESETTYELTYASAFEAYIQSLISASTITVDDTLSVSGDAADALAVGEKFAEIIEDSINLIDESKFDFTSSTYWTLETGYYFPVTAGKKICTNVAKPTFHFYDSSYTSLSSSTVVNVYTLVDIPEDAVYARLAINATANTLSDIQGTIMVYEVGSTVESNDDRRDYVPPIKVIGDLVEGDIYGTAVPSNLGIDILTAAQYKAVRALNHQRNAFRIGTFNIYVTRQRSHWKTLKQELKDYSLDICAMQEVSNSSDNSRYIQNYLTMNTWQFAYGSEHTFDGTLSDKAVVSMYEIVSTDLYTHSTGRTYTKTVINLPQYKHFDHQFTLSVYSAHLNLSASNRLTEVAEILATIANDTSDFIIICADTNAFESEADAQGNRPTWEAFVTGGFTPIHSGDSPTVTDGSTSIDQIFMGSNISCLYYDVVNSNNYQVDISGTDYPISDHDMVYADLQFDFDAVLAAL